MKKKLGIVVLTLVAAAGVLLFGSLYQKEQVIFINEVRCWDSAATRNGYYGSDYIELYNDSEEEVSLHGWYLSDDGTDLKKSQLQDVTIEAKGYVLLYANGTDETTDSLLFKLNPEGEKVFLSDAEENLVDSILIPKQEFGTVYARKTDGAKEWCAKEESTGYSNDDAKIAPQKNLSEPTFSHESGFYDEAFSLTIKAEKGQKIYYTLDGSRPDEKSNRYFDEILIENVSDISEDKATIIRAIAIDKAGNISEVATRTYFVGLSDYKTPNIISLAADPENLFGEEGIFVNGASYEAGSAEMPNFLQSGRAWEVEANFEMFEKGTEISNQKVGIRVQGASTRYAEKKKMSIYSREEYSGNAYFEGIKLGENQVHSIYTNHTTSNGLLQQLLKDRAVATQNTVACDVFLNGEFWYSTNILEKYNQYYVADTFGVARDNVIIVKDDGVTAGPEEKYASYQMLRGLAGMLDLSNPEEYLQFKEELDIQSYIDYIAANVYLCNMDMSEWKNSMLWRTIEDDGSEYGDKRWRWMIYDIDCIEWAGSAYYGVSERAAINSFTEVMEFTESAIADHAIYSACKSSSEFSKQFVLSFLDIANVNLAYENVKRLYEDWDEELSDDLNQFFRNRFEYIVPYMAEEFDLTGTLENVTLKVNDTEGGTIKLNTTTPDVSNGSWTGQYYTDYPVTVTAIPADGYEFVGWSGSVTSKDAIIEAEVQPGGIVLEAVFEKIAE